MKEFVLTLPGEDAMEKLHGSFLRIFHLMKRALLKSLSLNIPSTHRNWSISISVCAIAGDLSMFPTECTSFNDAATCHAYLSI